MEQLKKNNFMNIALEDLAKKTVKNTEGVVISDNNVNLSKFTGSEVIFTGKYTKGLLLTLRPQMQVTFRDALIDNAGTNVTVKLDGTYDQVKVSGSGSTKLFGKAGNAASQMIYFNGVWSNIELCDFEIDQRRDVKPGATTTGAAVQFAGVIKDGHNLGRVYEHGLIISNAGDEGNYVNHFDRTGGYVQGDILLVEGCKVFSSGRDSFQQWGFRNVTYLNCYGENGGLEADSNHCSSLSMNGDTDTLLVKDCEFNNIAQLIYSGKPTTKIIADFINVKYTQGVHAGALNNQAAYLKGPGEYIFNKCTIDATKMKEAAITADGCNVTILAPNNIIAPKLYRTFNGGTLTAAIPPPVTVKTQGVLDIETTTTYDGVITEKYFYKGTELKK